MLTLKIQERDIWDSVNEVFIPVKSTTLTLEHSLVSVSKWESKWNKPFLKKEDKTIEETIDYIRCMTLSQNVNPLVYYCLTDENIRTVNEYISAPMTATWFSDYGKNPSSSKEIITSELIYYWMIALNIPFECQKWHFNRLLTLIQVCNIKNSPPKKMSKREIMNRNKALNEARLAKMNTKG